MTCLVLLTSWGGSEYAWGSPVIVGLGAAGVVLIGLFILVERRASEPLLPLHLFRNPVFALSCAIGFIVGFALFGAVTYLPHNQQIVRGHSPTASGLQLLPMMLGVLIMSIGSGQLISRFGRYKPYPVVGTAVMAVGMLALSRLDVGTSAVQAGLSMFLLGAGLGLTIQVLVLAVQNAVEPREMGTATASATFFRSIGGSFGVAVFGTVFTSALTRNLADVLPGTTTSDLQGTPDQIARLPPAVHDPFLRAFADSIQTVFLVAVPVCLVGWVLTWFLREVPLRTSAAAFEGVSQSFGNASGCAAEAVEEAAVRIRAAEAALSRLDVLAAGADVPPDQVEGLRRLFTDRIAFLTGAARSMRHEGQDVSPEAWAAMVDVLQTERRALAVSLSSAAAAEAASRGGVAAAGYEAEARVAAARAALDRLEVLAAGNGVPARHLDGLREVLRGRIERITRRARDQLAAMEHEPAYLTLAVEVLETERRELAMYDAADDMSPRTADRVTHDLEAEAAALAAAY